MPTMHRLAFALVLLCSFANAQDLALTHCTVYASPDAAPLRNATITIRAGRIDAVGANARPPAGARVIDCNQRVVTAGFWNAHVHFTEPKWENSAAIPAAQATQQLQDMLTRWGFTTVVDTGSMLSNTVALRRRIESGDVLGPRIFTAGTPLYPKNGIPYYLRNSLPPEILAQLPQPATPDEAAAIVRRQLDAGGDIVKLFTGSWVEPGRVMPMDQAIATAAAAEAHRRGKLVYSHASSVSGLTVALEAKVDVVAHALDDTRGLTPAHIARMKQQNMAMVPTLKLLSAGKFFEEVQMEVGYFACAGGDILYGTDVGYLPDYDNLPEYEQLSRANFDFRQILRALTVTPAARFQQKNTGAIAPGNAADLVMLNRDPATDSRAFADVAFTIRAGRVLYSSQP